jgi:integrase
MSAGFKVKLLRLVSGERLPILVDGLGQPIFEATVYSLTELRGRNQATNTISSNLGSIRIFYLFLEFEGIDLRARLLAGELLSLAEIEELSLMCRLPVRRIDSIFLNSTKSLKGTNADSVERSRMRLAVYSEAEVKPTFRGMRMLYIREYLRWFAAYISSKQNPYTKPRNNMAADLQYMLAALTARIPRGVNRSSLDQREGLEPELATELLRVVLPTSADNPWRAEHTRFRNNLIINWLYYLGLRRGELLGVRISDLDFRKGTVTIHRRADDANDPRVNQPQAKSKARVLSMAEGLRSLTYDYLMLHRAKQRTSRKHDFLFCAEASGQPMSIPTLNKVFDVLRAKCPTLPGDLSPHVLRHTWNDRFSEEMDKRGNNEESEKKLRSYLMGWSESSETASTYTRRHVREKARQVSLEIQGGIKGEGLTSE